MNTTREQRIKDGLCIDCGKKNDTKRQRCTVCTKKVNEYRMASYRAEREAKK